MEIIKSLGTGFIVGVIFSIMKLPIPAPNNIYGILGIVEIFLGLIITKLIWKD